MWLWASGMMEMTSSHMSHHLCQAAVAHNHCPITPNFLRETRRSGSRDYAMMHRRQTCYSSLAHCGLPLRAREACEKNAIAHTRGAAMREHDTAPELAAVLKTQVACHAYHWRKNGHGQEQKPARRDAGEQICSEDLEAETATRDSHNISHGQNWGAEIRACRQNWRLCVGPILHSAPKARRDPQGRLRMPPLRMPCPPRPDLHLALSNWPSVKFWNDRLSPIIITTTTIDGLGDTEQVSRCWARCAP